MVKNIRLKLIRVWWDFVRFCFDIVYLLEPNKLFVFSWMKYKGAKLIHNNWGDDINKYFFESISTLKVRNISHSFFFNLFSVHGYSCIGSVFGNYPGDRCEVWGSGIIAKNIKLKYIPKKIYSVRGPLTRNELLKKGIDCPYIFGDPALLISRYLKPSLIKSYELGIIPHYTDEDNDILNSCVCHIPNVLIIKMSDYNNWQDIPNQICSCKRIISSSLHGLIMADSYRVPNAWVRFSNDIKGGNFKYLDYFASVGRLDSSPFCIKKSSDLENIVLNDDFKIARYDKINYETILNSCPFKEKLLDYRNIIPQLPQYLEFGDKEQHYFNNEYVNTELELDKLIYRFQAAEKNYIYRGVSEAKYKMYASSQRHWKQRTDWVYRMGQTNYYAFVEELVRRTETLEEVQQYMEKQEVYTNDMFLLALMQHFGVPSPMIDFTESLMTGLFFASDWDDNQWHDSGNNIMDDYMSLYYISKSFDWVEANVQSIMQSAAEKLQIMISEALDNNFTFDTKDTEDNIRRLLYRQFRLDSGQSNITFIPLGGPSLGRIDIDIPVIKFHCEYEIINDRIVNQQGMFIMNNTVEEPLVEVMNKQSQQKMFCCVNIHKRLLSYLREKYLTPAGKIHDEVYDNGNNDVANLRETMKRLA